MNCTKWSVWLSTSSKVTLRCSVIITNCVTQCVNVLFLKHKGIWWVMLIRRHGIDFVVYHISGCNGFLIWWAMFWANKYVQSMAAYPIVQSIIRSLGVGDSSVTAMVTITINYLQDNPTHSLFLSLIFSPHNLHFALITLLKWTIWHSNQLSVDLMCDKCSTPSPPISMLLVHPCQAARWTSCIKSLHHVMHIFNLCTVLKVPYLPSHISHKHTVHSVHWAIQCTQVANDCIVQVLIMLESGPKTHKDRDFPWLAAHRTDPEKLFCQTGGGGRERRAHVEMIVGQSGVEVMEVEGKRSVCEYLVCLLLMKFLRCSLWEWVHSDTHAIYFVPGTGSLWN